MVKQPLGTDWTDPPHLVRPKVLLLLETRQKTFPALCPIRSLQRFQGLEDRLTDTTLGEHQQCPHTVVGVRLADLEKCDFFVADLLSTRFGGSTVFRRDQFVQAIGEEKFLRQDHEEIEFLKHSYLSDVGKMEHSVESPDLPGVTYPNTFVRAEGKEWAPIRRI
jgi:hypothetical protein